MLGRSAWGLFWMFRYLERAENTARLLDAGFRMALTRGLSAASEEWRSVLITLGLEEDSPPPGGLHRPYGHQFRAARAGECRQRAGHDRECAHQCPHGAHRHHA
jgi:hypothetical protein